MGLRDPMIEAKFVKCVFMIRLHGLLPSENDVRRRITKKREYWVIRRKIIFRDTYKRYASGHENDSERWSRNVIFFGTKSFEDPLLFSCFTYRFYFAVCNSSLNVRLADSPTTMACCVQELF